jgi:hypothetical protein
MEPKYDYFISYRTEDQTRAEWVAWQLEDAGYTTFIQAWDFRPGNTIVHQMQIGAAQARCTIAILTPAYFGSGFTESEWAAAFTDDPTGEERLLIPVRVLDCRPPGLLNNRLYIDLVGLDEAAARTKLLDGVKKGRAKPASPPPFVASAAAVPTSTNLPASVPGPSRARQAKREQLERLLDARIAEQSAVAKALTLPCAPADRVRLEAQLVEYDSEIAKIETELESL